MNTKMLKILVDSMRVLIIMFNFMITLKLSTSWKRMKIRLMVSSVQYFLKVYPAAKIGWYCSRYSSSRMNSELKLKAEAS